MTGSGQEGELARAAVTLIGDSPSGEPLRSLFAWLQMEEILAGQCKLIEQKPRVGEMGGTVDAIAIILGSGGFSLAVARSIVTWLTHRTSDVEVKVVNPGGEEIVISSKRVHNPAALIKEIDSFLQRKRADPVRLDETSG